QEIISGLNLTVRAGEVLGLIGESGAGKSTIGLAAAGFVRPGCRIDGGEILFKGRDLLKLSDNERRQVRAAHIAYVAQSAAASFNPARRLFDQCTEIPVFHRIMSPAKAYLAVVDLFDRMRLPNPKSIGQRYPHQVSGGQLQRAMTAMAIAPSPDLIIFD